jgi:hypothetical protein
MADWHTTTSARDEWIDAPLDDAQLTDLLEVAKQAVLAYAPALPEDSYEIVDGMVVAVGEDTVPVNYRAAQLMQARNVWNSSKASPTGDFDGGSYSLTTFPLDWQVKQLLRPRSVFGGPVG